MGGITLDDFTQSVAYREIFGRGEAKVTLRLLSRRCGPLSAEQESLIRSLPLERLEALLDCEGMAQQPRLRPPTVPASPLREAPRSGPFSPPAGHHARSARPRLPQTAPRNGAGPGGVRNRPACIPPAG